MAGLPKIGIRPAIDSRRKGMRESLEAQTMGMAQRTADFLSANLYHQDGLPVECIISDTCIGGVAEAAQTAEKFRCEGAGLINSLMRYGLLLMPLSLIFGNDLQINVIGAVFTGFKKWKLPCFSCNRTTSQPITVGGFDANHVGALAQHFPFHQIGQIIGFIRPA